MQRDLPILSIELEAVPADGRPTSFVLEVQKPFFEDEPLWRCVVTMDGFQRPLRIGGGDPFQALCLAIDFVRSVLADFEKKGGILMSEGERFRLDSYSLTPPD